MVALAIGWFMTTPPWRQIAWTWQAAAWGLVGCLPLLALMFALRQLKTGPLGRLNHVVDRLVIPLFTPLGIADFAIISIVAGIGEEMLFRGVIQTLLVGWSGMAAGLGVASLLFGLAHIITPTYAVLATLIGGYLGWIFWRGDNLLTPIVVHSVYDFAALVYLTRFAGKRGSAADAGDRS